MARTAHVRIVVSLTLAALIACSGQDYPADPSPMGDPRSDPLNAEAQCTSGVTRDQSEPEGAEMMPGHACIQCHRQENAAAGEARAPLFAIAGTVFPTGHEPDDCIATSAEGAQVIITGADGATFSANANTSGNFYVLTDELELPFRAKVLFDGKERSMGTAQSTGDCNSCHTATGANGAPGRIVLP